MEIHFQILGIHVRIVFALMDVWSVGIASVQGRTATILGRGRAAKTTAMVRPLNIKIALEQIWFHKLTYFFFSFFSYFTLMNAH